MVSGKSKRLILLTAISAVWAFVPAHRAGAGMMKADWVTEDLPSSKTKAPKSIDLNAEYTFEPIDFDSLPANLRVSVRALDANQARKFDSLPELARVHAPLPAPGITGVDVTLATPTVSTLAVAKAPTRSASEAISAESILSVLPTAPLSLSDPLSSPANVTIEADASNFRMGSDAPAKFAASAVAVKRDAFPYLTLATPEPKTEDVPDEDPLASKIEVETVGPESSDEASRMPMGLVSYRALSDIQSRVMGRIIGPHKPAVLNPAKAPLMSSSVSALDGRQINLPSSLSEQSWSRPRTGSSAWVSRFNSGVTVETPSGARTLPASDPRLRPAPEATPSKATTPPTESKPDGLQFNLIWTPGSSVLDLTTDLGIEVGPNVAVTGPADADLTSASGDSVSPNLSADGTDIGSTGGAGGGGGAYISGGTYVLPTPVASLSNLNLQSPPSLGFSGSGLSSPTIVQYRASASGFAAAQPLSLAAPTIVQSKTSAISRQAISAISPAVQTSPVGSTLPTGITGYNYADLHPIMTTWASSQSITLSGGRLGGLVTTADGSTSHAATWSVSSSGFVDMQPTLAGWQMPDTTITGISGQRSVGIGSLPARYDHALYWANADPNSVIDINPSTYTSTYAQGISGNQVIGYGYLKTSPDAPHAVVWNGDPSTGFNPPDVVDLNPANFIYSYAYGTDSVHQVGSGLTPLFQTHALLWAGSAGSVVDIHPSSGDFSDSAAVTVSGTRLGGYGTSALTFFQHAILWTALDAGHAFDITPASFDSARVTAMNAFAEVGVGALHNDFSGNTHALLWNADGTGFTDLNKYLPATYVSAEADSIDAAGNVSGWATDSITGNVHAVEWLVAVPEPTSLAMLGGLVMLMGRNGIGRRKRTRA